MSSVYQINKAINRPIEFKGLKAQYIWWLGGGLLVLLLLFAAMYIMGISVYVCVVFILVAGAVLFFYVFRMSKQYGEHGLMKKMARQAVPKSLRMQSRQELRKLLVK
jgi:predicted lysophospholipase L1 biosynthesis ABC-type transport system permease subunit